MRRQEAFGRRGDQVPIRLGEFADGHEVGGHETRSHARDVHQTFCEFVSVRLTWQVGQGSANRYPHRKLQGVRVGCVFYDDWHGLMLDGLRPIKGGVMNVQLAVVTGFHRRFDARALEFWLAGSLHGLAGGLVRSELTEVLSRWEDDGHRA